MCSWIGAACVAGHVLLHALGVSAQGPPATGAVGGQVVDARTGQPLGQVVVAIEGGPSTRTDDRGRYDLPMVAAGPRTVVVSVVGYVFVRRDIVVPAAGSVEVTIPLTEGTGTYTESLTVTADPFRAAEPGVPSQQVLSSADLQNLRGVLADDPLRAVQVLPGVAAGDDLRSEFSVRGSGFNRMNFTVDGFNSPYLLHTVRAIEDYSASGSVAMINSDILEDVTLLNGGYAQRFGNRTGSELDFRLREGSRDRRQVRAGVSGSSASVVVEGPLGSTRSGSWLVSGRHSYLDLLVERFIDEGLHFRFADAQAKIAYDVRPRQRVELALLAGWSRLEGTRSDLDEDDLFEGRNATAMAIGSWRLTRTRAVVTAKAMTAYNRFSNDTVAEVRLDDGHDTQAAGRVDGSVILRSNLQLETGGQAEWTSQARMRYRYTPAGGNYRLVNDFAETATRAGVYAQMQWSAGPVTLIPGLRADRWTLTGEATTSPWAQAEWRLPLGVAVRGGAGVYRQFPDFEQVVGTLGHPGAGAEEAAHVDAGLEQRLGDGVRWQITYYERREDGFYRRPGAETRIVNGRVVRGSSSAPYEQRLEGRARGVEFLVQRKSPNGLSGWISYAFGRHRQTDTVSHESFWGDLDQRHTLNAYVFYRLSSRTSLTAKLRAGSNTPAPGYYVERDGVYYVTDTRNAVRLPVYSRLDFRANRTFSWGERRLTLFAEVMNVLNRDNVRFNPPGVNTRTAVARNLFEPLIPIVPSAGLLIEF